MRGARFSGRAGEVFIAMHKRLAAFSSSQPDLFLFFQEEVPDCLSRDMPAQAGLSPSARGEKPLRVRI